MLVSRPSWLRLRLLLAALALVLVSHEGNLVTLVGAVSDVQQLQDAFSTSVDFGCSGDELATCTRCELQNEGGGGYACTFTVSAVSGPAFVDLSLLPTALVGLNFPPSVPLGVTISAAEFPKQLRALNMSRNSGAPFPPDFFVKLNLTEGTSLEVLDISGCGLEHIVVDLRKLPGSMRLLVVSNEAENNPVPVVAHRCDSTLPLAEGVVINGEIIFPAMLSDGCGGADGTHLLNLVSCFHGQSQAGGGFPIPTLQCFALSRAWHIGAMFSNATFTQPVNLPEIYERPGVLLDGPSLYIDASELGIAHGSIDFTFIPNELNSVSFQRGNGNPVLTGAIDLRELPRELTELGITDCDFTRLLWGNLPPVLTTLKLQNNRLQGELDLAPLAPLNALGEVEIVRNNFFGTLDLTSLLTHFDEEGGGDERSVTLTFETNVGRQNRFHRILVPCPSLIREGQAVELDFRDTRQIFRSYEFNAPCCDEVLRTNGELSNLRFDLVSETCGSLEESRFVSHNATSCQFLVQHTGTFFNEVDAASYHELAAYAPAVNQFIFASLSRTYVKSAPMGSNGAAWFSVAMSLGEDTYPTALAVGGSDRRYLLVAARNEIHVSIWGKMLGEGSAPSAILESEFGSIDGPISTAQVNLIQGLAPEGGSAFSLREERCLRLLVDPELAAATVSTIAGACAEPATSPVDGLLLEGARFVNIRAFAGKVVSQATAGVRWYVRDGDWLRKGNDVAVVTVPSHANPFALSSEDSTMFFLLPHEEARGVLLIGGKRWAARYSTAFEDVDVNVSTPMHLQLVSAAPLLNTSAFLFTAPGHGNPLVLGCAPPPPPPYVSSALQSCATQTLAFSTLLKTASLASAVAAVMLHSMLVFVDAQSAASKQFALLDTASPQLLTERTDPVLLGSSVFDSLELGPHCIFAPSDESKAYFSCGPVVAKLELPESNGVFSAEHVLGSASGAGPHTTTFNSDRTQMSLSVVTALVVGFDFAQRKQVLYVGVEGWIFAVQGDEVRVVLGNGGKDVHNDIPAKARVHTPRALTAAADEHILYFLDDGGVVRRLARGAVRTVAQSPLDWPSANMLVAHPRNPHVLYAFFNSSGVGIVELVNGTEERWHLSGSTTVPSSIDRSFTTATHGDPTFAVAPQPGGGGPLLVLSEGGGEGALRQLECHLLTPEEVCLGRMYSRTGNHDGTNVWIELPAHGIFSVEHGQLLYKNGVPFAGQGGLSDYLDGNGRFALFGEISDLVPVGSRHVIAVDQRNSCLRLVDLSTRAVTTVAGKCGEVGTVDGPRGVNRLSRLTYAAVRQGYNALVFTDAAQHGCVKVLDLNDWSVGSLGDCFLPEDGSQILPAPSNPSGVAAHGELILVHGSEGLFKYTESGDFVNVAEGMLGQAGASPVVLDRSIEHISAENFVAAFFDGDGALVILTSNRSSSGVLTKSLPSSASNQGKRFEQMAIPAASHLFVKQDGTLVISEGTLAETLRISCFFPTQVPLNESAAWAINVAVPRHPLLVWVPPPQCEVPDCRLYETQYSDITPQQVVDRTFVAPLRDDFVSWHCNSPSTCTIAIASSGVTISLPGSAVIMDIASAHNQVFWLSSDTRPAGTFFVRTLIATSAWETRIITIAGNAGLGEAHGLCDPAEGGVQDALSCKLEDAKSIAFDNSTGSLLIYANQKILRLDLLSLKLTQAFSGFLSKRDVRSMRVAGSYVALAVDNRLRMLTRERDESGQLRLLDWWGPMAVPSESPFVVLPCGGIILFNTTSGAFEQYEWRSAPTPPAISIVVAGNHPEDPVKHLSVDRWAFDGPARLLALNNENRIFHVTLHCRSECISTEEAAPLPDAPSARLVPNILDESQTMFVVADSGVSFMSIATDESTLDPRTLLHFEEPGSARDALIFSERPRIGFAVAEDQLRMFNLSGSGDPPVSVAVSTGALRIPGHIVVAEEEDDGTGAREKVLVVHEKEDAAKHTCIAVYHVDQRNFSSIVSRKEISSCEEKSGLASSTMDRMRPAGQLNELIATPINALAVSTQAFDQIYAVMTFSSRYRFIIKILLGVGGHVPWKLVYEEGDHSSPSVTTPESLPHEATWRWTPELSLRSIALSSFTAAGGDVFDVLLIVRVLPRDPKLGVDAHFVNASHHVVSTVPRMISFTEVSGDVQAGGMSPTLALAASGAGLLLHAKPDSLLRHECVVPPFVRAPLPPNIEYEPEYTMIELPPTRRANVLCEDGAALAASFTWGATQDHADTTLVAAWNFSLFAISDGARVWLVTGDHTRGSLVRMPFSFPSGLQGTTEPPRELLDITFIDSLSHSGCVAPGPCLVVLEAADTPSMFIGNVHSRELAKLHVRPHIMWPSAVGFSSAGSSIIIIEQRLHQLVLDVGKGGAPPRIGRSGVQGWKDGEGTNALLDNPVFIAVADANIGYLIEHPRGSAAHPPGFTRIRKVDLQSRVVTLCFTTRGLLRHLAIRSDGHLVIAHEAADQLVVVDPREPSESASRMDPAMLRSGFSTPLHPIVITRATATGTLMVLGNVTVDGDTSGQPLRRVEPTFCTPSSSDNESPYFVLEHVWPKSLDWLPSKAVEHFPRCTRGDGETFSCSFASMGLSGNWDLTAAALPRNVMSIDFSDNSFAGQLDLSKIAPGVGKSLATIFFDGNAYTQIKCCLASPGIGPLSKLSLRRTSIFTGIVNLTDAASLLRGASGEFVLDIGESGITGLSAPIQVDTWPDTVRMQLDGISSLTEIWHRCSMALPPLTFSVVNATSLSIVSPEVRIPPKSNLPHCECANDEFRNIASPSCGEKEPPATSTPLPVTTELEGEETALVTTESALTELTTSDEATAIITHTELPLTNEATPISATDAPSPASEESTWCTIPEVLILSPSPDVDIRRLRLRNLIDGGVKVLARIANPSHNHFASHLLEPGAVSVVGGRTRVRVHSLLNETDALLVLSGADGIRPHDAYTIDIVFARESFECPHFSGSSNLSVPTSLPASGGALAAGDLPSSSIAFVPDSRALPPAVKESTQATTVSAGAAAGLTASPAAVSQMNRANMLLSTAACSFSHTAPLDLTQSPTGMAFGSLVGAFYRGGVVGTILLFGTCIVFHLFVGVAWFLVFEDYRGKGVVGLKTAIKRVHFPGLLAVPLMVLLPGLGMTSVAVMRHGTDAGDPAIGALGIIIIVLGCAFLMFPVLRRFDADFEKELIHDSKSGTTVPMTSLRKFFHSEFRWTDRGRGFKNSHGPLFADFVSACTWFALLDLATVGVEGLLDGIRPASNGGCVGVAIGMAVSNTALLGALIYFRPFAAQFNQLQALLNAAVLTTASIIVMLSLILQNNGSLEESGESVATIAVYVAAIRTLVDIILLLHKTIERQLFGRPSHQRPQPVTAGGEASQPLLVAAIECGSSPEIVDVQSAPEASVAVPASRSGGGSSTRGKHRTFDVFELDEADIAGVQPTRDDDVMTEQELAVARGQRAVLAKSQLHDEIRDGLAHDVRTQQLPTEQQAARPQISEQELMDLL